MTIDIGTVLGERWELEHLLATGGMSEVYQARDARTDEIGAVKVLRTDVHRGATRFEAEVATLRQLRHPHVVRIVDAGEHDDVPYLVMELVPGPTLAHILGEEGRLGLERTRRLGVEIAGALAYAHDLGIVNRDVKPSNVLFDEAGSSKLADFGVAVLADSARITGTGFVVGTAGYIAPEQLTDQEDVGPPADVYALGLVLLEAITGRPAFTGPGTEAALARLSRDPEVPSDLPDSWRRLLGAMTARDPGSRPEAAAVVDILATSLSEDRTRTARLPGTAASQPTDLIPEENGGPALADDRPHRPDLLALARRYRHWAPAAAIGVVAIVAVLVLAGGGAGVGEEPDADTATDTELPPELADAFDELQEAVQP